MTVRYPFDPTGMAADNLVIEESHAVTEAHYRDYHFLIPDFAPFYAEGLVIRLAGSDPDQILVAGVDYFEVLPYLGATRSIGKPVYGAIALNSRWTSGVLLLSYQTVGGKWVADRAHVYRALAEKAYNPRTCTWDVLTNVTDQFPPINHTQNFSDYYDEGDLIQAIGRLGTNIAEEADNVPVIRHLRNFENPHRVNLEQLGIPLIGNWRMADAEEALAGLANDILINPQTLAAVRHAITVEWQRQHHNSRRYISHIADLLQHHQDDKENPHAVTKAQLGIPLVENWRMADDTEVFSTELTNLIVNPAMLSLVVEAAKTKATEDLTTAVNTLNDTLASLTNALTAHREDQENPHAVTTTQLGIGKVGNWAMATVDEVTAGIAEDVLLNPARLAEVVTKITDAYTLLNTTTNEALIVHQDDKSNPHQVSKAQVGLGLVENLALASDLEVANGDALDKYVTLRQIVQYLSARGGLLYNVIPARFEMIEGEYLDFVLTTARVTTGATFYWSITHGTTTSANFVANDGTVAVVDNTATIRIQANLQVELNPDRTFSLLVREDNIDGRVVALSDPVTLINVTKLPDYTLTASPSVALLTDTTTIQMDLVVTNTPVGTTLYWEIGHENTTSENFIVNASSFILSGTRQTWNVMAYPSMGDRFLSYFTVRVRKDAPDGEIVCVSERLTFQGVRPVTEVYTAASLFEPGIGATPLAYYATSTYDGKRITADSPTTYNQLKRTGSSGRRVKVTSPMDLHFSLTPSVTAINEGDSLTITVRTDKDVGGQTYYWGIVHTGGTVASDFVAAYGSVYVVHDRATITIQSVYKGIDDPDRSFKVSLYLQEGGSSVASTAAIQFINIAANTLYRIVPDTLSFLSKVTKQLNVSVVTPPQDSSSSLRWQISHLTSEATDFAATSGLVSVVDHAGRFTIQLTDLVKRQTLVQFRIELRDFASTSPIITSAVVSVWSDLQAAALIAIEDLYDPFVTINAQTYYWVGNMGRRIVETYPLLPHDYTVVPSKTVMAEGDVVRVNVTATNFFDPVTIYWTVRHISSNSADFSAVSGSFVITAGNGHFDVQTVYHTANESDKTFFVDLRLQSGTTSAVIASTPALTLQNVLYYDPVYSVTTSTTQYNSAVTRTIALDVTTAHTSDATYTWKLTALSGAGNVCYVAVMDSVTTVGNVATVNIGLKDAILNYATSSFKLELLSGTTHLAYSPDITVVSPTYSVNSLVTSQSEGLSWPLSIVTTALPTGTTLYWTIALGTATANQFVALSGSVVSTGDSTSVSIDTVLNKLKGSDGTFTVSIRTGSSTGSVVATTGLLTIRDVYITIIDTQWAMCGHLYDVTPPIDAADYYMVGTPSTLRR